jgi:putative ABC transport system permease protein
MIKNFLKTAFRNLLRNKTSSIINILGLSVGLAVFIAIGLFIQLELNFDKFNENYDRIFRIEQNYRAGGSEQHLIGAPPHLSPVLIEKFPEIETATRFVPGGALITTKENNKFEEDNIVFVDNEFLDIFTVHKLKAKR